MLPFDPPNAPSEQWTGLHTFRRVRHAESFPEDPLLADAEYEAMERKPSRFGRRVAWMARVDGRVVGMLSTFVADTTVPGMAVVERHLAAGGGVMKNWRRHGVGTRLLAELHGLMVANGKATATLTAEEPDGHAFLRHLGAGEKVRNVDNRLALDAVDWEMVERWHAALRAVPGLTRTIHAGRVPAAEFEGILPAINALIRDVPRDRLDFPIVENDMRMIEEWYRDLDVVQGQHHLVLLRDAAGAVAGVSDVVWRPGAPDRTFQVFTGVRRDLRGLGLGKGLKAAVLRHVRSTLPTVQLMLTGNAEANAPMLAINARLGYAVHKVLVTYQIGVDALGAATGRSP
ncbi:hypothetical protein TSO221_05875 [Azospirillum sp. TSO22-1]|nr:hypothetical protein TSO221_05875 [Azospirillum sp. TSO22-1]